MKSQNFEEITIEELGKRYARIYACDLKDGNPQRDLENHFNLGSLYLSTGRYTIKKAAYGLIYRIPSWSDFSEKSIAAREAEYSN